MIMDYTTLSNCLCCDSTDLFAALDLNDQPLANSYKQNKEDYENTYPLVLNVCKNCYHAQLSIAVNPDLLFKHYLYVSGTSKTLNDYSKVFANDVVEKFKNLNSKHPDNILDIACNDGTQLNYFKELGLATYGIDPATNLFEISQKNHNVKCDYYRSNIFDHKFDLILAQNVFAHNSNPYQFLLDCKNDLADDGLLFIQTSQANMIVNNEFDTIYHEHISFFNTNSMLQLSKRVGLPLIDVFKTSIHGTSYVFVFSKTHPVHDTVNNNFESEQAQSLYSKLTYEKYAIRAKNLTMQLKAIVSKHKANDYHVVGYGAAAKGNTLLNFGQIELDFIIDDNPLKNNLYTPGMSIPISLINKLDSIDQTKPILFVPLAWNFFEEIKSKLKTYRFNNNDLFVRYFPSIELFS